MKGMVVFMELLGERKVGALESEHVNIDVIAHCSRRWGASFVDAFSLLAFPELGESVLAGGKTLF